MHNPTPIIAWSRSPVAAVGGALSHLQAHELAAPVLQSLLAQTGLPASAIDAVVLGNAMGAGGNPARMLALAAGLPDSCAALSVDTQCCSGLDAIAMAVGLLQSGQAEVVIAGGAEAWSRAPIRQTRPMQAGQAPQSYERPPFAPDPARDPDMLQSAANYALQHGYSRSQQEQYALRSHARAVAGQARLTRFTEEITAVAGLAHDTYPRTIQPERAARMPAVAVATTDVADVTETNKADLNAHALSALTVSAKADGAALILLATPEACTSWNLQARALWLASASIGAAPETPLLAAIDAANLVLKRGATMLSNTSLSKQELPAHTLSALELHDAFAVQGLAFCSALGLTPDQINPQGGGLARGHPIGASGAIALVRCLAQLQSNAMSDPQANAQTHAHAHAQTPVLGMAAIAGAGGIGAATLVQWVGSSPMQRFNQLDRC